MAEDSSGDESGWEIGSCTAERAAVFKLGVRAARAREGMRGRAPRA